MTNYPLCECAFREAVRRRTVQTGWDTKLIAMLSLLRRLQRKKEPDRYILICRKRTLAHCHLQTQPHTQC